MGERGEEEGLSNHFHLTGNVFGGRLGLGAEDACERERRNELRLRARVVYEAREDAREVRELCEFARAVDAPERRNEVRLRATCGLRTSEVRDGMREKGACGLRSKKGRV